MYASFAESYYREREAAEDMFSSIQDDERKYKRRKEVGEGEKKVRKMTIFTTLSLRSSRFFANAVFIQCTLCERRYFFFSVCLPRHENDRYVHAHVCMYACFAVHARENTTLDGRCAHVLSTSLHTHPCST